MLHSQNIFDDDALEKPEVKPVKKPAKPATDDVGKTAAKPARKKKKPGKKKRKAIAKESSSGSSYAPEEIARSSYSWAPETEPVVLSTMATGMKGPAQSAGAKHQAVAMNPETLGEKPASQGSATGGFKLPQIPLAQVLIVAGFVILFLIYRFRVGRQIKRKRY